MIKHSLEGKTAFRKKKLLLAISPYISLVKHCAFSEIQLGPALVRSVLDERAFDIDYLDINEWVRRGRTEIPLFTSADMEVLSSTRMCAALQPEDPGIENAPIVQLINSIAGRLASGGYDYVLFSLPVRSREHTAMLISLNFTLLLARQMKLRGVTAVLIGGPLFRYLSAGLLCEVSFRYLSEKYADAIFLTDAAVNTLPLYLQRHTQGLSVRGIADVEFTNGRAYYRKRAGWGKSFLHRAADLLQGAFFNRGFYNPLLRKIVKQRAGTSQEIKHVPLYCPDNGQRRIPMDKVFRLSEFLPEYSPAGGECHVEIAPLRFMKGCPQVCFFCVQALRPFSCLSPLEAVDLLERTMENNPGMQYFRFLNTQINVSPRFAVSFADEIRRRGLKILFVDSANLRSPHPETFAALRQAGCVKLWLGAETYSPRLLKITNKKLTIDQIQKGIALMHGQGIWLGANIITGFPYESEEDHRHNLEFMRNYRQIIDAWQINLFILYPGTPFYLMKERLGIQPVQDHRYIDSTTVFAQKGQSARERTSCIKRRYDELLGELPLNNELMDNDYLLFYLHSRFAIPKEQIRKAIETYSQRASADARLMRYLSALQGFDYKQTDALQNGIPNKGIFA